MTDLLAWQWALLIVGSILVGISKTGIAGVGIFSIAVFANAYPARESTGLILPLLVVADIVAVISYRQHAQWKYLWRLFPWVAAGVVAGYGAMKVLTTDKSVGHLIGAIVLVMVALHLWREQRAKNNADLISEALLHHPAVFALIGLLCGFTTMVANAAGPIMILYMLAVGLPKMEFMGTSAWYFFLINTFKLPFSWHLGLLTPQSLALDALLIPVTIIGALFGRVLLRRINQKLFAAIALICTMIAAVRLLFL